MNAEFFRLTRKYIKMVRKAPKRHLLSSLEEALASTDEIKYYEPPIPGGPGYTVVKSVEVGILEREIARRMKY